MAGSSWLFDVRHGYVDEASKHSVVRTLGIVSTIAIGHGGGRGISILLHLLLRLALWHVLFRAVHGWVGVVVVIVVVAALIWFFRYRRRRRW